MFVLSMKANRRKLLIAAAVVVGLHAWKRNMLLSIAGGTILYMILVQTVFAG